MPVARGPRGLRHPARWNPARRWPTKIFSLTGQVVAANGVPLQGATVDLFEKFSRTFIGSVTSDANGIFTFYPSTNGFYFVDIDFAVNGTEQAGASIRNLVPS